MRKIKSWLQDIDGLPLKVTELVLDRRDMVRVVKVVMRVNAPPYYYSNSTGKETTISNHLILALFLATV